MYGLKQFWRLFENSSGITFHFKTKHPHFSFRHLRTETESDDFVGDFSFEQEGFVICTKTLHSSNKNSLKNNMLIITPGNQLLISAPEGKQILRVNLYAANEFSFDLKNSNGEPPDPDKRLPVTLFGFDAKTNQLCFTCQKMTTMLCEVSLTYRNL